MKYIMILFLLFSCAKKSKEAVESKILEKISHEDVIYFTLDNSIINNTLAIKFDDLSSKSEQLKTIKIFNKKPYDVVFDLNFMASQSNGNAYVETNLTTCDVLKYNEVCFLTLKFVYNINGDYNLPEVLKFNNNANNGIIGIYFENTLKPKFLLKNKIMSFSYEDNIFEVENYIINNNSSNFEVPNIIVPTNFKLEDNKCNVGGVQTILKPNGICSFKIKLNVPENDFSIDNYNVLFESNGQLINEDLFLDVRFKRNMSFKTEIILSHNETKRIYLYNNSGSNQALPSANINSSGLKTINSNCTTTLLNGFGCFFDVIFDSSSGYVKQELNVGGDIMTIHAGNVNQCTVSDMITNKATSSSIVVTGVKVGNSNANCKVVSCDSNHDIVNNICVPKSCSFDNASEFGVDLGNVMTLAGNIFACQVSSCKSGYRVSSSLKSCIPIMCDINNASEFGVDLNHVKNVSGEALNCEISECLSGYSISIDKKKCYETPCTLENAFNYGINMSKVTGISGGINSCEVSSCSFGYNISSNKKSCIETSCNLENADGFGVDINNVSGVIGTSSNCSVSTCNENYQISITGKSCEPKKCDFSNSSVNNVDITNVLTVKNDVFNCEVNTCKNGYLKSLDNKSCYETPCDFSNAFNSGVTTDNALILSGGIFSCEIDLCRFGFSQNATRKRCNEIPCSVDNAESFGVDMDDVLSVQGSALDCEVTSCATIEKRVSLNKKFCEIIPCSESNAAENGINLFEVDVSTLSGGALSCQVNSCMSDLYEVSQDKKSCIPKHCSLDDASLYDVNTANALSVSGTVFECKIDECEFGYLKNDSETACHVELCSIDNYNKYGVSLQHSIGIKEGTTGLNCELSGCDYGYRLSLDKKKCEENICTSENAPANINTNNVLEFEGSFVNCAIKTCEFGYKKNEDNSSCEPVTCDILNAIYYGISLENLLEVESDSNPEIKCKVKSCQEGSNISADMKSCIEEPCLMSNLPEYILLQDLVVQVEGPYSNCQVKECQLGFKPTQNKRSCEQAYCYENPALYGVVNDSERVTLLSLEAPYCEVVSCITQVSNVEEVIADPLNTEPIFNEVYYYEPTNINGAIKEDGSPRNNTCSAIPCSIERASVFGINPNKVLSMNGLEAENCAINTCENGYKPDNDGMSCIPDIVRTPLSGEYYSVVGTLYNVAVGESGGATGSQGLSIWYWGGSVVGTTGISQTTLEIGNTTYYRGVYHDTFYGDPHFGIYKIQIGQ